MRCLDMNLSLPFDSLCEKQVSGTLGRRDYRWEIERSKAPNTFLRKVLIDNLLGLANFALLPAKRLDFDHKT